MHDPAIPENELRMLEEKRLTSGLTPEEWARLAELEGAQVGFDVNAAAAQVHASIEARGVCDRSGASSDPQTEFSHTPPEGWSADEGASLLEDLSTAGGGSFAPLDPAPSSIGVAAEAAPVDLARHGEPDLPSVDIDLSGDDVQPPLASARERSPLRPSAAPPASELDWTSWHAVPPGESPLDLAAFEAAPGDLDGEPEGTALWGLDAGAPPEPIAEILDEDIVEVGEGEQTQPLEAASEVAVEVALEAAAEAMVPTEPQPAPPTASEPLSPAAPEPPVVDLETVAAALELEPPVHAAFELAPAAAPEPAVVDLETIAAAQEPEPPAPAAFEPAPPAASGPPMLDLQTSETAPQPKPPAPAASHPAAFVSGRHRVVLHTGDGQVKRGTVCDQALDGGRVVLEQQPAGAPEVIPADRIKAIFFMLAADETPLAPEGLKVRVTFRDGRQVAGFCSDYAPERVGFFMVPADTRTHTARIWVYRSALRQIAVS